MVSKKINETLRAIDIVLKDTNARIVMSKKSIESVNEQILNSGLILTTSSDGRTIVKRKAKRKKIIP